MKNKQFQRVPYPRIKRSAFDLSHEKKLSFQIGHLVPVLLLPECLPSDKFRIRTEMLVRFQALLAPILHMVDATIHYFKVPYRLIWDDAEDFFTGGRDGTVTPVMPYILRTNANNLSFDKGRLSDYLGIPPTAATITQDIQLSLLPFRAYWKIYNDYYRIQDLEAERSYTTTSGQVDSDYTNNSNLAARAKQADYLTSCLTAAQRGNAVEIDLDILGMGTPNYMTFEDAGGNNPAAGSPLFAGADPEIKEAGPGTSLSFKDGESQGLEAVLEITELRRAARLLEFLERQNIGSGRYRETIEMHFGQKSSDARLDHAEYCGGHRVPVQISEVMNQSQVLDPTAGVNDGAGGVTVTVDPQAQFAGKAIAVGGSKSVEIRCEEHCIIMGILSVMPRNAWQEGVDRFWRKTDKTEFYWPSFANLGEQDVYQSEIYWDPTGTDMDDTFGYQSRYAEYKWQKSTVAGDFIDDFDYWHMGNILGSAPTLNTTFAKCENTDYDRIFAVTTGSVHKMLAQVYHSIQAIRPMPEFNMPSL